MSEITNNDYELAWDLTQSDFSVRLANNILVYKNTNKKTIKTVLDICCKTSNMLNVFSIGNIKCFGYETNKSMLDYSEKKYPKFNFKLSSKISEIPFKSAFDLITCCHDVINDLNNLVEVSTLFKNVFKHLSNHGMFIFDFMTKIENEQPKTSYELKSNVDCVTQFKPINSTQATIINTFYINNEDGETIKANRAVRKYFYTNSEIIDELKKAGFKNISIVNENLSTLSSYDKEKRIYVIAMKK